MQPVAPWDHPVDWWLAFCTVATAEAAFAFFVARYWAREWARRRNERRDLERYAAMVGLEPMAGESTDELRARLARYASDRQQRVGTVRGVRCVVAEALNVPLSRVQVLPDRERSGVHVVVPERLTAGRRRRVMGELGNVLPLGVRVELVEAVPRWRLLGRWLRR